MANEEELVKPFKQDHFTGIQHNYEQFTSHDYNSTFDQLLDTNLQIGVVSYEDNEVWNPYQEEHKPMHPQNPSDETKQGIGLDGNQKDSYLYFPDNVDSRTAEIDKSTVIEATRASYKKESEEINDKMHNASPDHEMVVGMEFSDVKACRKALRDAAISLRFEMQTIKSDKTRFTAKCLSEGCPWRIHCAKLPNAQTFTIRTIHGSHTCGGISHLGHQQASAQWIADVVGEKLKENPDFKPKEILEEIHRVHGIALSYKQAWRGKERIIATLRGSFEEEYSLLPQYCDEIIRTNPGSTALVYRNPIDDSFQQLFISFKASITGFLKGCRPVIALDRTYLKSKYPGMLLLASGFDGDGAVLPLAFAIVDEENDSNWHRFLSELRKILEINSENNIPKLTILSTREKPILDAVEANFPTAFHGLCVHYLTEQFRSKFQSSMLVILLWEAAHSLTILEFKSKISKIEEISKEASLWIQNISPSLWASSYFEGTRFGQLTANVITQSLSNWIQDASNLPIIQMMECFHSHLMNLFKERRETSSHWSSILVPSAESKVLLSIEQSHVHRVYRANETEFEVMTIEGNVIVDIENRSCLCRGWEIYGLPCSHAAGAILSCKEDVYRFTERCFTVENYKRTYEGNVEPVLEKTEWRESGEEDVIRTPKALRVVVGEKKRRKRRVRREDIGRVKRTVRCSKCNEIGHFRTTCNSPM